VTGGGGGVAGFGGCTIFGSLGFGCGGGGGTATAGLGAVGAGGAMLTLLSSVVMKVSLSDSTLCGNARVSSKISFSGSGETSTLPSATYRYAIAEKVQSEPSTTLPLSTPLHATGKPFSSSTDMYVPIEVFLYVTLPVKPCLTYLISTFPKDFTTVSTISIVSLLLKNNPLYTNNRVSIKGEYK
jgi:hypothetical protein